jgi:acyl-coenzyme A synthetase/AMP-(fatty) acid ligase
MELKDLLANFAQSDLAQSDLAQLTASAEDFEAVWQIPSASMRRLRPMLIDNSASDSRASSWCARSHCLSWKVPGAMQVSYFRQMLAEAVQQQPWMRAQWLPLAAQAADSDWALLIPKQSYLDFEYVDISDMPLMDDESWWSDYGQLLLSLTEAPMVHRLLKLDEDHYLYLCCFWPDYLSAQAMLDWLQVLAKAWHGGSKKITEGVAAPSVGQLSALSSVLEQRLRHISDSVPLSAPLTSDLQQQQQVISASAQQALLVLAARHQCQLMDLLAVLTALLAKEYFAPTDGVSVVCYPLDTAAVISAAQSFLIREFVATLPASALLADLLSVNQPSVGYTWGQLTIASDLPMFAVHHLRGDEVFRFRPSHIQGVQLWLVETPTAWHWQLFYDTQRFMPLQWLSRLEQLLMQLQTQTSLRALLFLTDAEQRLYQRTAGVAKVEDANLVNWLYHHALLSPEQIAIEGDQQQLSYRQLWLRSTQWSQQLKAQGAGSEQVVALHFQAGIELIVAMIAVWLSGAAVLIVDPRWPLLRKRYLIKQTAAQLIIGEPLSDTDDDVLPLQDLPASLLAGNVSRPTALDGDALAVVLMTTEQGDGVGGVEISHRQMAQQIYSSCQALGWLAENNWRLLLNAEIYSEALLRQLGLVFSQGATLVLPREPLDQASAWQQVTQAFDYVELRVSQLAVVLPWLQSAPPMLALCRQWVLTETPLSGQPLAQALTLRTLLPAHTHIWVAYACAESLSFLALFDYRQRLGARYAAQWPIGKMLAEVEYRVVNAQGRLCPWGLSGDLYLRSVLLTPHTLPPNRSSAWLPLDCGLSTDADALWLRTGDRVQHDHKGQLFWMGRDDGQCYLASLRVSPRVLASTLRTLGRVQSLALLPCAALAQQWVIWQPRISGHGQSASAGDWQQLLRLLKGFVPESLLPRSALAVNEDADRVAWRVQSWLAHAPQDQLLALQDFLQQPSAQQQRTLSFWQQRFAAVGVENSAEKTSLISPAMQPAAFAQLDANFMAIDNSLATLSLPTWLAALRLTWQMLADVPALLWCEVDNAGQAIRYADCLFAHAQAHSADRRAADCVAIAEEDWQQGLNHQPACLPLLAGTETWPVSQKLAWMVWQVDDTAAVELLICQQGLTQRLQALAREFIVAVGVLRYGQQTCWQVIHADAVAPGIRELSRTWLQQLAYLRDFPLLPLAGLQCLSASKKRIGPLDDQQRHYSLTLPQQELLMLLRGSEQPAHIALGYWLDHQGALNLQAWQQIVQQWVNAFVALRTSLMATSESEGQQGDIYQVIARQQEVVLLSEDWSEQRQDWQAIAAATQALIDRPRLLLKTELIEYYVIQLSTDLWRLLIIAHPLVLDDRACNRLLLQMYQQYVATQNTSLTTLPPSLLDAYPAFLHQQQNLSGQSLTDRQAEDRRGWVEQAAHKKRRATHHSTLVRPHQLPRLRFAGVLPADALGYRCQSLIINEAVWLPLVQRARREAVPVAFVIKVFYSVLLAQYSEGQQDSLLFEYEAGRSGLFVDSLGCFCRRRALWIPQSLLQSKTTTIEQLLQHSKLEYDQTRQLPLEEMAASGLTAQMGFIDAVADQGVMLGFSESLQQPGCVSLLAHAQAQRLTLRLHYYAQEFNPLEFLPRLLSLLEQWLAGVSRLGELDFLLPEERHQQMQLWSQGNRRIAKWPPIYRLIDEQVTRTPDALAVQCGTQSLTYQQMENLAAQTAQRLLQLGCQPGEAVMVCTHAQLYLPSAILGILKTAACYLPVDISKSDWRDMLRHCRVRFLLTQSLYKQDYESLCPELTVLTIDQFDVNRVRSFQPRPVAAKDPLYVLYRQADSMPLLVSYEAEANLVQWYCSELAIKSQDRLLWYASADFYASQKNIFAALVSGACLVMSAQRVYDPEQLLQEIDAQQISLLNITPSAFYPLLAAGNAWQALASLRVVIFGKEAVEVTRLRQWLGRPDNRCRVLITYTQDVCADVVSGHWLDLQQDHDFVPLGKPVHGVQMFVMDALGRLKPTGLNGQIVILGQTVGRYVDDSANDPSLVDVPGVGRLFYSGDVACYAKPGQLRYIGRLLPTRAIANLQPHDDAKNKDIENKLRTFEGVVNAKLVQLDHEWVVYLQLANEQAFSADALRNKLQWLFPEKNLPLRFVSVDQLPTDAEGDAA